MTLPAWAQFGARCVCVDDAWTDIDTGVATTDPRPVAGNRYTIILTESLGSRGFIAVTGFGIAPDLWAVSAFRPLTSQERDEEMFRCLLKDASVGRQPELEPAR